MATLADIAREAKCSVNLVSYVLNKKSPITKQRHKEILEIAQNLNYVSNRVASALVTGRTNNLILMVNSNYYVTLLSPFFKEFLYELTSQLTEEEIGLTLYSSEDKEKIKNVVLNGMADGVIWYLGVPDDDLRTLMQARDLPYLCLFPDINNSKLNDDINYLTIDDYVSEYNMLQYLYNQNHRRILFAGAAAGPRYRAYVQFCQDNALPLCRNNVFYSNTDFKNREVLKRYFDTYGMDFTAIVADNDGVAISLLYVLKSLNIRVPEDVSVVGYDDLPDSSKCDPPLTTVHQNYREIVTQTKNYFIAKVAHRQQELSLHSVFVQKIVLRDSVAKIELL